MFNFHPIVYTDPVYSNQKPVMKIIYWHQYLFHTKSSFLLLFFLFHWVLHYFTGKRRRFFQLN